MSEFFHMGGYAAYVWPSFALAVIVFIWNVLGPISRHKKAMRKAQDYHENNAAEDDD